ncbi:UDP-glucose:glycoprotein glucosyltransferase-domain-containing protein [Phlyctochytrium arcticum]|nr:UDP-glucose:glycoprotein glucosyltransferase-domain-containing protein [Phlyctochytrium arcticum]
MAFARTGFLGGKLLILILNLCTAYTSSISPPIEVSLKTGWRSPPLILEALEFIAEERSSLFFPTLERWIENGFLRTTLNVSESVAYSALLNDLQVKEQHANGGALQPVEVSLLKLSLSTRALAPRVEAFYSFYENEALEVGEAFDTRCDTWAELNGLQFCQVEKLVAAVQEKRSQAKRNATLPFDHHYPSLHAQSDGPEIVLYADIWSKAFANFHGTLAKLAADGEVQYTLRFKSTSSDGKPLYVPGYGVELALKSTEYKVVDDRDVVKKDVATDENVITRDRVTEDDALAENPPRVMALTAEETSPLGLHTAQYILGASDPMKTLVDITQNFPKFAHLLKDQSISSDLEDELAYNRLRMSGRRNGFWVNGQELDAAKVDIFSLQRILKSEVRILTSLTSLNLTAKQALTLLTTPLAQKRGGTLEWGDSFDVRSDLVKWWNDLESDAQYSRYAPSITSLVHRNYPGQLRYVRKNMVNVVIMADLTNPTHLALILQQLEFIERSIPIRFGIAPLGGHAPDSAAMLAAHAFYRLFDKGGVSAAKQFLLQLSTAAEIRELDNFVIKELYKATANKALDVDDRDAFDALADELKQFAELAGTTTSSGAVFINGNYIPLAMGWHQRMISVYFQMIDHLVEQVSLANVGDDVDLYAYFMTLPNVLPNRNALLFTDPVIVDLLACQNCAFDKIEWLPQSDEPKSISIMLFADFSLTDSWLSAASGLAYSSQADGVRITFLHTGDNLAIEKLKKVAEGSGIDDTESQSILDNLNKSNDYVQPFMQHAGVQNGNSHVLVNGRIVGPIPQGNHFQEGDYRLMAELEFRNRIGNVLTKLITFWGDGTEDSDGYSLRVLKATSALSAAAVKDSKVSTSASVATQGRLPLNAFEKLKRAHSSITSGSAETALFHFFAIVDPVSEVAQKISGLLHVLSQMEGAFVEILVNPQQDMKGQLPVKRFYRYVVDAEPRFSSEGALEPPKAVFLHLPEEPLYTLGMDVANSWTVFPVKSVYDLDNIKLSNIPQDARRTGVVAELLLENILVEGHARDTRSGEPPRGLQFVLGTKTAPELYDTITMANLGYLQLKANPGSWDLAIREGRSRDLYEVVSASDYFSRERKNEVFDGVRTKVIMDSFEGITLLLEVQKRAGREGDDLLVSDANKDNAGLWQQLKTNLFHVGGAKNETINIFSVASGHLYERFLSIMMLSVKQQTKNPVKFWLIRDFLSPSFKEFLPDLAREFGFDYELVTYKWPHWLRQQTEKQRTIWGYKLLFLDTLFPLNLEKVIFVDADQVVRADLKELVDMDLEGAVYGYTPFCSDRTEMDGFRFWKQGYWKEHLRGKPYHISALYVVDLNRFRLLAAGDQLRQQYQMLSADANSLANLDQDLPNNMNTPQQLPIHSLPQEWLWCETWCSDESLKTAKTIDLCNNPLTKEPKLERARRILPEWDGLDKTIAALAARLKNPGSGADSPIDNQERVHEEL